VVVFVCARQCDCRFAAPVHHNRLPLAIGHSGACLTMQVAL